MKLLILLSLLFICKVNIAQTVPYLDSLKNVINNTTLTDDDLVENYFLLVEDYMDNEQYDSAQFWLNKIHIIIPLKQKTIEHYFLYARQAEVYYYNNLHQLGLQESRRGLQLATILNDSLLIADSYNFVGLFLINMDSLLQAVKVFEKGIQFAKSLPYPKVYKSITKPHHLYGNLSEVYYKLGQYELSLTNAKKSLQLAKQFNQHRAIALANVSIGDIYIKKNNVDSAQLYFKNAQNITNEKNINDVQLLCKSGLAETYYMLNQNKVCNTILSEGTQILKKIPNLNRFYALLFLTKAIELYGKTKEAQPLIELYKLKTTMDSANLNSNNIQIQAILNASVENEKRLANLKVVEAKQKQKLANIRLLMALATITLLVVLFLLYRYYLNQKIALSKIKQKISQDLHDDIGATLSSLQLYSVVANTHVNTNPERTQEFLTKITNQTTNLMENINDIVWSMKQGNEQIISFDAKVKNYVTEIFAAGGIVYTVDIAKDIDEIIKSSTAKRNVLMVIKEALNNIVKYSKASEVKIIVKRLDNTISIIIMDNGIGFDTQQKKATGNGLQNIEKRIAELKGKVQIESKVDKGTTITAIIPLATLINIGW